MQYAEISYQQAFRYTKEFIGGVRSPDGSEVKVFHLAKRPKLVMEHRGKCYLISIVDDLMELVAKLEVEDLTNKSEQDEGAKDEDRIDDDFKKRSEDHHQSA